MGAITAFARSVTTINLWVARVMNWAVVLLFLLLLTDVVMRKIAGSPIQWSQQLSKLLFGVYAILGGGYLLARRGHVAVDLFYANFSRRKQAFVDILTSFLFFLLLGILVWQGSEMFYDSVCKFSLDQEDWCQWEVDKNAMWEAPLWPSKGLIVVAALLLLLQGIVKLIADIMIVAGVEVDETAFGPVHDDEDGEKETV